MASDRNTIPGVVLDCLPNSEYTIELKDQRVVRCYLAGKMKLNRIRVIIGDQVDIVLPERSSVGRVVRRR